MALTSEQIDELSLKLTRKLVDNSLTKLTWQDILAGIDTLSDSDKNAIVESLSVGSTSNISTIINSRLAMFLEASVTNQVNGIIADGSISLDLLYIILK